MAYKRILFGTDGSAAAQAAGSVAAGLARAEGAQLIVGFAFERPTDAEQIVATAIQQAEAAGVRRVSGEARAGVPADALIALADGHDVGLVVVSGGRGKKYGLGQVAHRLAVRSPRDVLLVSGSSSAGVDGPLYRTGADRHRRIVDRRPRRAQGVRAGRGRWRLRSRSCSWGIRRRAS